MPSFWSEDPDCELGPQAACRHCGRGIRDIGLAWEDHDGFVVCVKAPADGTGGFVPHEPMPAGLAGASAQP